MAILVYTCTRWPTPNYLITFGIEIKLEKYFIKIKLRRKSMSDTPYFYDSLPPSPTTTPLIGSGRVVLQATPPLSSNWSSRLQTWVRSYSTPFSWTYTRRTTTWTGPGAWRSWRDMAWGPGPSTSSTRTGRERDKGRTTVAHHIKCGGGFSDPSLGIICGGKIWGWQQIQWRGTVGE